MESKIEKDKPKEPQTKKWRYLLLDYFTDIIQYEQNLDSLHQSLNQQNYPEAGLKLQKHPAR